MKRLARTVTLLLLTGAVVGCQKEADERQLPPKPEPQPAASPAKPTHPEDAVAWGGHWYKLYENEDASWHEARDACRKAGGYLACIETAEEQAFIAKLADGEYFYLGGTDEEEEGDWRWVNGAKWDFTAWSPAGGQPNNWGDAEHYLATYDYGEWVDVAAEGRAAWMPIGYICEWEE
jgi:hypothetical protein